MAADIPFGIEPCASKVAATSACGSNPKHVSDRILLDLLLRPCPPLEEAAAVKVTCMAVHEITEVPEVQVPLKLEDLDYPNSLDLSCPVSPFLMRWLWHRGRPCKSLRLSRLATILDIMMYYWNLLDHSLNGPVAPLCCKALYALWTRGLALGGGQAFGGGGSA